MAEFRTPALHPSDFSKFRIYTFYIREKHYAKIEFIAKDFPSHSHGVVIVRLYYTENVDKI